jgi:hypothetical protein
MRQLLVTANIAHNSPILVTIMMGAIFYSETSVLTRATRRNIPEDGILHSHGCENLKSYKFLLNCILPLLLHRRNSVGIAAVHRLESRRSSPGKDKRFHSTPQYTERLWDPPILLSSGYLEFSWRVKQPEHEADLLNLVPRSRTELYLHSPIHLHGLAPIKRENKIAFAFTVKSIEPMFFLSY